MPTNAVKPVQLPATAHHGLWALRARGFTLIELIMVMVLLGILAAYAAPRIFNRSDFDARGFHDETVGILRFLQKSAIAQRRTVCVTVAGTCPTNGARVSVTASIFTKNPATTTCAGATVVPCNKLPVEDGEVCTLALPFQPQCGGALAGTSATFAFTPEGRTDTTGTASTPVTVTVSGAGADITVDGVTGYVHD